MPFRGSRREFLAKTVALAAAVKLPALEMPKLPDVVKSPFRIAVINDEIAQDFGHAAKSPPKNSVCDGSNCGASGTRTCSGWIHTKLRRRGAY